MNDQERDDIARGIYESVGIRAGFSGEHYKPWGSMREWEKQRWRRAADAAVARRERQQAVKAASRIVQGQVA